MAVTLICIEFYAISNYIGIGGQGGARSIPPCIFPYIYMYMIPPTGATMAFQKFPGKIPKS
jgi:hypothetical protein